MKSVLFLSLVVASLLPSGLSIKCYQCTNNNGNCEEDNNECTSSIFSYNRCIKLITGDKVIKGCTTKFLCDAMRFCDNLRDCEAYCCEGDGCNSSSSVAPAFLLVTVAALVTKLFL